MPKRRKNKNQAASKAKSRFRPRFHINLAWIRLPSINWFVIKQSLIGVAWLAGIAGIVVGWALGVPKLQAFASQRNHVDPSEVTIRFNNPPLWMKGELADSLLRTATMQIGGDPLVRDDLVAVREVLLETGWFDSINQVRRISADVVDVDAKFVQPYAVIRDDAGDHLVDITGKLLPKTYPKGAKTHFIAVAGVHFQRPQQAGMTWEGADIAAGIGLLQLIDKQPWRNQIAEVDVSEYLNDGPIKLRTNQDCVIVWGGAPGEEPALEVLAEGKLQRLNFLFQKYKRIDGNLTGELDITGEKAVVTR